jgi:hypothetical protein
MEKILNQVQTDGDKIYHFHSILDAPESFLFQNLNSYIVNCPFVYFRSEDITFDSYMDFQTESKLICQNIHNQSMQILLNYHNKKFITNTS